jgi:hypothetical protein
MWQVPIRRSISADAPDPAVESTAHSTTETAAAAAPDGTTPEAAAGERGIGSVRTAPLSVNGSTQVMAMDHKFLHTVLKK